MAGDTKTILKTSNIGKEFSSVWVLRNIDFDLSAGEIHALAGENGAGKSTFIKILSGLYAPSEGVIELNGKQISFQDVKESEIAGIRTVHQEINLVPFFTVYENMFIGDEMHKKIGLFRVTDDRKMRKRAKETLALLDTNITADTYIHGLDASCQRIVQIAKVLAQKPTVMIFDEPTTSLGEKERHKLLEIIVSLKSHGIGILFISHNLDEIMKVADRVTVFRDGALIGTRQISECNTQTIISMMIGQKEYKAYKRTHKPDNKVVLLEGREITNQRLNKVNIVLHKGEILGVAGVVGAGKSELARALFGIDRVSSGSFLMNNERYKPDPQFSLYNRIALVPEERQAEGLVPNSTVERNISLAYLRRFRRRLKVDTKLERKVAHEYIDKMSIKTTGPSQGIRYLSGGNQQKVVLSRWLYGDFDIGLFDEPTKGIDVKAKEDIYMLIGALADQGKGVIFFSSYLPELLIVCDRIMVLAYGNVNGEFLPEEENVVDKIVHAMLTGKKVTES